MDQNLFKFDLIAEDPTTHARAGVLHTPHGDIETPIFMPVGTKANVKGIPTETVKQLGAQIVLANTYHLSMRPGADLVEEAGGVHKFMNYYLPTTIKLLNAYDRMDNLGVSGANIDASKGRVEQMLTTVETAYDKQLDALFQDEAMDISADVTVLEQMMAQEGLTDSGPRL